MIEAKRRYLGPTELSTGQKPAVTRHHVVVAIDQNRDIEAKSPDAVGDLPDLLLTVESRINGVGLKFSNQAVHDLQKLRIGGSRLVRTAARRFHKFAPVCADHFCTPAYQESGEALEFRNRRKF